MTSNFDSLADQIDQCLIRDRQELRKILAAMGRNAAANKPYDRLQQRFERRAQGSCASAQRRQARPVKPEYDQALPIAAKRDEILAMLRKHQVIVLAGETGSGKTTQLPKFCLELERGIFGMIGHTQPRRLAARAVAGRIAEELQVELGGVVGYQVRFSDAISDQTRVKLMTDGILLAEIQNDPLLLNYDTLIIDEAHERSLNIDFLLGYLKRLLPKRPDLKLIITSATIDLQRFARHFDAPVIEVSGRTYPVEVLYRPLDEMALDGERPDKDLDLQQAVVQSVREIEQLERGRGQRLRGDVLVFLSGEREIRETAEALRKQQFRDTEVLPLYARLSQSEQNRIFHPSGRGRRIVLATNVAETSLTVPGIRYVIDPGLARISRYSYRTKVQRLPVEAISQASANQRKGRCGRVAEGVCIRLFSEEDFNNRPAFTDAEILRTNLASVILQMEGLKLGRVEDFPFIDPPDSRFIKDGIHLLQELGALDDRGRLTPVGRQLSRLPVDPRIGRMLIEAQRNGCLREVLVIASALSIQDPRERPLDKQQQADEKHRQYQDPDSDFIAFLNLWNAYEQQRQELSSNQLRRYCRQQFLAFMRMREWRDLHRQLHLACRELGFEENKIPCEDYGAVHRSLLAGLLSHVGLQQENREYLGARNRKFMIFPGSVLAKRDKGNKEAKQAGKTKASAKWVMSAELVETSRLYARVNAKIDPCWLETLAAHLIKRHHSEAHWQKRSARVMAYEQQTLYGLPVVSRRKVHFGPIDPQQSQQIFIRSALVEGEFNTKAPFFSHNRALLQEVEALEEKSRRRDILIDEEQLYEFYRELFLKQGAEQVINGAAFEQWRQELEREDPRALFFNKQQLMQHDARQVTESRYPDQLVWQGMRFPLSYRFEPGAPDDGVTLSVPVGVLERLPHRRLEWLVPGMLRDKCIALLKGLPKKLRKNFVPIPDYVDAFLERSVVDDVSLTQALAQALRRMTGVMIAEEDWAEVALDDHHRLNYRLLAEDGQALASGRDWQQLARRFAGREMSVMPASCHELERHDVTCWDFGMLPEEVQVKQAGIDVNLLPALTLEGDAKVAVKLFDNPLQARRSHRQGLNRLLQMQIQPQIKRLRKSIKHWPQLALMFSTVGSDQQLWSDFVDGLVIRAFIDKADLPRTPDDFDALLQRGLQDFHEQGIRLAEQLAEILKQYRQLNKRLSGKVSLETVMVLNDVRSQLQGLIHVGFIGETPIDWFERYPCYLQAIELRLDKFQQNLQQQRVYSEQLTGYWQRYVSRLQNPVVDQAVAEALEEYRWMLEEYRISLFAQPLKTRAPVSAKRLDKLWTCCI